MDSFNEWTEQDLVDAQKIFSLAVRAGDQEAARHMYRGICLAYECRSPRTGVSPDGVLATMCQDLDLAFGTKHV